MSLSFKEATNQIIEAGHFLDVRGWAPATAGNYSARLKDGSVAVTVSGKWKGQLTSSDTMIVDLKGAPKSNGQPSAETLLHTMLYRLYPHVNAVLHSHSVNCIALTRMMKKAKHLVLSDHEMLKVFPGITTHKTQLAVPILDNAQDMVRLSKIVEKALRAKPGTPIFLLRGHGLYGWGRDMEEAKRVIEGAEFMLSCEMLERKA